MSRIGIFGGSFDPFHFGHLNLAIELMEKGKLDQVYLVPTSVSPFKQPSTSAQHRLKMVQLVVESIKNFKVLDYEIHQTPPCYTIDTLNWLLQNSGQDVHFVLMLSDDSFARFTEWKEYKEILKKVELLIGSRFELEIPAQKNSLVIKTARFDCSATDIRQRLKKGLYCGHLVPHKVLDYIYENQLY